MDEEEHVDRVEIVDGRVLSEAAVAAGTASCLVGAILDKVFGASALSVVAKALHNLSVLASGVCAPPGAFSRRTNTLIFATALWPVLAIEGLFVFIFGEIRGECGYAFG